VAHGFQTLENDAELFYQMSESYVPDWRVAYDGTIRLSGSLACGRSHPSDRDPHFEDFQTVTRVLVKQVRADFRTADAGTLGGLLVVKFMRRVLNVSGRRPAGVRWYTHKPAK